MNSTRKFFICPGVLTLLLFLIAAQTGISQSLINSSSNGDLVDNVNYSVSNDKIFITYNLNGDQDQLYNISLMLKRTSNQDEIFTPKAVSGDIGEGHYAGKNRQIIWDIEKDFPEGLSGEDYYFIVQAKKIDEGSNFLMWAGLGVAATAAAVATFIIVGSDNGTPNAESESSFPFPPGRP